MGMAEAQEVRDAVLRFRAKKKFAIAYSETFGEFGPGNGAIYIATAFDKSISSLPGTLGLTGLMIETQFLKGTLDKTWCQVPWQTIVTNIRTLSTFTQKRNSTDAHKEATAR